MGLEPPSPRERLLIAAKRLWAKGIRDQVLEKVLETGANRATPEWLIPPSWFLEGRQPPPVPPHAGPRPGYFELPLPDAKDLRAGFTRWVRTLHPTLKTVYKAEKSLSDSWRGLREPKYDPHAPRRQEHFEWLLLKACGRTVAEIAGDYGRDDSTVWKGLKSAQEALGFATRNSRQSPRKKT
jgi:hypothetical protein